MYNLLGIQAVGYFPISGNGSLTKTGSGVLTLTVANTYSGDTTVDSGRLVFQEVAGLVHVTGNMIIASGGTLEFNTSTPGAGQVFTDGNATITGGGTWIKSGSGNLGLGRYGTVNVSLSPGALIDVQGGYFEASTSNGGYWNNNFASLNVDSGAIFDGKEHNVQVDALTGSGTVQGGYYGSGNVLTVGVRPMDRASFPACCKMA